MPTPSQTHSRLLQLLLDAESSIRIAIGDELRFQVSILHDLGLVDYRKSGYWQTSEAGHRLVGGSHGVEGFLAGLKGVAERARAENELLARPRKLKAQERRKADSVLRSARLVLRWLEEGRA